MTAVGGQRDELRESDYYQGKRVVLAVVLRLSLGATGAMEEAISHFPTSEAPVGDGRCTNPVTESNQQSASLACQNFRELPWYPWRSRWQTCQSLPLAGEAAPLHTLAP
jgi:hypothetical protein